MDFGLFNICAGKNGRKTIPMFTHPMYCSFVLKGIPKTALESRASP